MKIKRNVLTLGLMVTSVVLLVLLEMLWLFRSYEKELFDFRRETSVYLRDAVGDMRDSILLKNVQWLPPDSLNGSGPFRSKDSIAASITKLERTVYMDSLKSSHSSVRVFITSPEDSLRTDIIKPLIRRIGEPAFDRKDRAFILRVSDDTLDPGALRQRYSAVLRNHDLPAPERIQMIRELREEIPLEALRQKRRVIRREKIREDRTGVFSNTMTTERVPYTPLFQYHASFSGVRGYLAGKLAPEILFSAFVTALTCGAFVLVYRSLRRQQRLVELKDTFISNITHELKTPVATVAVALEAMKNFRAMDRPQLTHEYLDIALKELGRLTAMTDNILNTSALETEKGTIKMESVDLKLLSEEVISSMKLLAAAKGATVVLQISGNGFIVQGHPELLLNALTNLVDNAIKYSGSDPQIVVSLTNADTGIILSVRDNGPGIDPAFHRQIFDKFFRIPKGDVHTVKGYGLGLNYVRSVVRLHGAAIDLNSSPDTGSEFIITFPKPAWHR